MIRLFLTLAACCGAFVLNMPAQDGPAPLLGQVDGDYYVAANGAYRIRIPVLPQLGGTITDTQNVVVFQDDYSVHLSVGAFPQDATQHWELSTRGLQDYLTYFFGNFIMPDFIRTYPGAKVETATFAPQLLGGALFVYTLLPGGSMFEFRVPNLGASSTPPVAKRGNLVFIQKGYVYVISMELSERVTEGSAYHKTPEQENQILRRRLTDLASTMQFLKPAQAY